MKLQMNITATLDSQERGELLALANSAANKKITENEFIREIEKIINCAIDCAMEKKENF